MQLENANKQLHEAKILLKMKDEQLHYAEVKLQVGHCYSFLNNQYCGGNSVFWNLCFLLLIYFPFFVHTPIRS